MDEEPIKVPDNWPELNFGEKLVWLYEHQKKINEALEKSQLSTIYGGFE